MKHIKKILTLGLGLGLLGGAVVGAISAKEKVETQATDPETYIQMETSFFTDWTNDAGRIDPKTATFWPNDNQNYSFEALDDFYRGEAAEGWIGTLHSRSWQQSTKYVYFQLGGARDFDHANGHAHLVFNYGTKMVDDDDDPLTPEVEQWKYSEDFYNNTFVENPMTLRYYEIPTERFTELTANADSFKMSLDIVDPCDSGYGFVNLGYLHVNQTEESTSDAMRYFLNNLSKDSRQWEINKRKEIMNTYFDNADQKRVFFRTVSNVNDTFSSNDDFLNHWYFDHNYFNNVYFQWNGERDVEIIKHFDKAIGSDDYRPDAASNMPFNNDGNFFRGWYEESLDSGFAASDGLRYRFVSRPFTLSDQGSGLVSIKMAGKASLHVIDPTVKNTDSQPADLAWVDNKLIDSGSQANIAASGFNSCTMVNHVINLEAYKGRTIQLAIADRDTSGWSAAYFDTLKTDYSNYPGFKVDYCEQVVGGNHYYPSYADRYMNSQKVTNENEFGIIYNDKNSVNTADDNAILNHVDNSPAKSAHAVWTTYLSAVRGGNHGTNYCNDSIAKSDATKAALGSYNTLSESAKQIVCASDDFERVGSGDWYSIEPTIYSSSDTYRIGRSIANLANKNEISVVVYGYSGTIQPRAISKNNTTTIVIVVSVLATSLILGLFFVYKKRKFGNK